MAYMCKIHMYVYARYICMYMQDTYAARSSHSHGETQSHELAHELGDERGHSGEHVGRGNLQEELPVLDVLDCLRCCRVEPVSSVCVCVFVCVFVCVCINTHTCLYILD